MEQSFPTVEKLNDWKSFIPKIEKMKKINQYIYKQRLKKFLAETQREKRFVNYDNAKSIIILFESDFMEKNRFVKRVIEQFKAEGKKVSAWGYLNKKEVASAILPDFRILNKKTCDWTERPQSDFLRELAENEYDLLIDLTVNEFLPLKYVLLYAKAACKTGIYKNDDDLLDFKLQIPENEIKAPMELREENADETEEELLVDEHFIFNQIIFYLKTIQTND
ncbi:conserved hypothetical protein [uncultured Paludibacter sp.]|uniref:Uncharacterized protein n=1 Tax=uncultured Paludibacter sp. TaxID=497635 RepID=A0A653AKN8_9BACT|nr:conserved hypothetical protein [uncultured Paludibacter sp.]